MSEQPITDDYETVAEAAAGLRVAAAHRALNDAKAVTRAARAAEKVAELAYHAALSDWSAVRFPEIEKQYALDVAQDRVMRRRK